jgi:hypothetical protein
MGNFPSEDRETPVVDFVVVIVIVVVVGSAWNSGLNYCENKESKAQGPETWPSISSACILTLFPSLIQSTVVCEDSEVSNV